MMTRFYLIILLVISVSLSAAAQSKKTTKIDSLLTKLAKTKKDTSKILVLSDLLEQYLEDYRFDLAKKTIAQEIALSEQANWQRGVAIVAYDAALLDYYLSNIEKSAAGFEKAYNIAVKLNDNFIRYRALGSMARCHYSLNQLDQAQKKEEETLAYFKKVKDLKSMASETEWLGYIFYKKGDQDAALRNYEQALAYAKLAKNRQIMVSCYIDLATFYADAKKNLPKAIEYGKEALATLKGQENTNLYGVTLQRIGQIYQSFSKFNEAVEYFLQYAKLAQQQGNKTNLINAYAYIGFIYRSINDHKKALTYLKRAYDLAGEEHKAYGKEYLRSMYTALQGSYYNVEDYDNALLFQNKIMALDITGTQRVDDLNTIAWLYFKKKDYDKAFYYANEGLQSAEKLKYEHSSLYSSTGSIIRDSPDEVLLKYGIQPAQRFEKAISYISKSKDAKIKAGRLKSLTFDYEELSLVYEKMHRYDEAFKYYKRFVNLRDSLNKIAGVSDVQQRVAQFEFSKTEDSLKFQQRLTTEKLKQQTLLANQQQQSLLINQQKLSLANRQQELSHLEFLKTQANLQAEQNKRKANEQFLNAAKKEQALAQATVELQKVEIKSKRLFNYLSLGGIVALALLSVFIGLNYRNQRRSNRLLAQANEQITSANHQLSEQREEITAQRDKLEETVADLQNAQQQLIQAEKMASLGELTAGIAHEIQNPLNFVNNFAEVSVELIEELKQEAEAGNTEDVLAIADDLILNLSKINHHGKRADGIVKGMLQHSRTSTGQKEATNLNKLADEYLHLAYHGLRAKDKSFNSELVTNFDDALPLVKIIPQDVGRVLLNLVNNAFYSVQEKAKLAELGYKPVVEVATFTPPAGGWGVIVKDNGMGMPKHIQEKIMQPFFTTKPTGEGTGLGLSLSYDIIVKGHGGKIDIKSAEGEGAIFTITAPVG